MLTVEKLIEQLEKIENKQMGVVARQDFHVRDVIDVFDCEINGETYICLDCEAM